MLLTQLLHLLYLRLVVHIAMTLFMVVVFCSPVYASDVSDVVFKTVNGGEVVFSHELHTKTAVINDNCLICHKKLYRSKAKRPVKMAEMERGRSCGACHGKIAFSLSACGRCHSIKNVTFHVEPTGDVIFVHAPHTDKHSCRECHPRLFKPGRNSPVTMSGMEHGKSCGNCHQGQKAFPLAECSRCHHAGNLLMKVTGAGPVTFSHGYHTKIYRCADCHSKIFPLGYTTLRVSMYEMDQGKSCGACHNDYTAFTVKENCVRCHDM